MVLANAGVFPRAGNVDLVFRKRAFGNVMERIAPIGLNLRVVLVFMQDEETDRLPRTTPSTIL